MKKTRPSFQLIVVGASAGGMTAIQRLLFALPKGFRTPIVFVQHLPADSNVDPGLVFARHFKGPIHEALDKMPLEPGQIYFAAPGYHLSIERDMTCSLSQDELVNYARPSIDVCFESIAHNFGPRACAVLLTGANSDGARGLRAIQESGGFAMAQDPGDAEYPMMPRAALEIMKPDFVGKLDEIAPKLAELNESETV